MSGHVVRTEITDDIGRVLLDRPEAMNAVTVGLGRQLEEALLALGERDDVSVIVLRGAGGNFCAGGDFHEVARLREDGPDGLVALFTHFRRACRAVADVPQPVVAAVEGVAMAGGFELMQACDIALVRDDARLADNHINFGQVPGGGGSQRLPRLVGRQRALGLLLSGDRLDGREALAWGLAYRSFPAGEFDAGVDAFVRRLASRRPDALRSIKHLVRAGLAADLEAGLDLELRTVVDHIAGAAGEAGVTSFTGAQGART